MEYNINKIQKGIFGEFSKIQEEWDELTDARNQGGKILELCELSDLYGAIEGYIKNRYQISMDDLKQMSEMTQSAFLDGSRK